jgi:hypothetical protein
MEAAEGAVEVVEGAVGVVEGAEEDYPRQRDQACFPLMEGPLTRNF